MAATDLDLMVFSVDSYTSAYAPADIFSLVQSIFDLPSIIAAGLNVREMPSLLGKSFKHVMIHSIEDSTMSLVMRRYGIPLQEHLVRSSTVRISRSIRERFSPRAVMCIGTGLMSSRNFSNSLSPFNAAILKPRCSMVFIIFFKAFAVSFFPLPV